MLKKSNKFTTKHLQSTWGATMTLLVGLVVFALLMRWIAPTSGGLSPAVLVFSGLILALVPALLWLGVFYLQDRLEPEPKGYVLGVFVLGALLSGAIGEPLLRDAYQLSNWGSNNLLANILIRGALEAALVYIAVRATVYLTPEFDEPLDGMIYGIAAGLGQATMISFHYVLDNGGVDLAFGATRIVIDALVFACVGGVVGWGLSQARFTPGGGLAVPLSVMAAALINGFYIWAQNRLTMIGGLYYNPIYGLALGVAIALTILLSLFALLRRSALPPDSFTPKERR